MTAVVLAHQPEFDLGPLRVSPETRSVVRDGREEILEPRVMQVLVVLAEAGGHVVARDDLVERCWNGRIVGDDAIHRIISRLRRLAEGLGRDVFTIETVTKVGYRLRRLDEVTSGPEAAPIAAGVQGSPGMNRRQALLMGGGAALLAGAGGWWWQGRPAPLASGDRALLDQARLAAAQRTREGQSQAAAILRQLAERYPEEAEIWALLGITYAQISHVRTQAEAGVFQQRAREAAEKALALDHDNGDAIAALVDARPNLGTWLDTESRLRDRLTRGGDLERVTRALARTLNSVGRNRESLALFRPLMARTTPSPGREYGFSRALWAAGRVEETDTVLAKAAELYPTHFAIWFARFYNLLYSGRQSEALALAADFSQRPTNIAASEVDVVARVARASLDPTPARVGAVIAEQLERSRKGTGHAENAAQFAVLLGQPDTAIAILRAYYFGEGFVVPETRYGLPNDTATPFNDRLTAFLFGPSIRPLHGSAPFREITRRLGLDSYWRQSATQLTSRGVPAI